MARARGAGDVFVEFPQTEWVLLEEAINFVMYGACFSRRKPTLADLNAEPKRSGSLFENVPDLERHRFIIDFGHRLGDAVFAKHVRLRGIREAEQYESIPFDFFAKPRSLSFYGDSFEGCQWRDVLVHRSDFLDLVVGEYPHCAKLMSSVASDNDRPAQATASPIGKEPVIPRHDEGGGTTPVYRTGAPGRQTSRHLVEPELRRRAEGGSLLPTLSQEAKYLKRWLQDTHPAAPSMTKKTIENAFRD